MNSKKSENQKIIDKATKVIDEFRLGTMNIYEARENIGKVFSAFGDIENQMISPFQDIKFTKVRIKGEQGSDVNKLRGELYANAINRIKTAIKYGYYFECIALCDTIIVDRLDAWTQAILHTSERQFPASTVGSAAVYLGKTMERLDIKKSAETKELLKRVSDWAEKRNEVLHNFVIVTKKNARGENPLEYHIEDEKKPLRDVGAREQYALETSEDGYELVRDVIKHADNETKRIKANT